MTTTERPGADDAPASGGAAAAWSRMPGWARVLVGVVAILVVADLLVIVVSSTIGGSVPSGRPSSAFATAPEGLAAYAELLRRDGHPITQQRGDLADADLDADQTLVLLDPSEVTAADLANVRRFVATGGRLVVGGPSPSWYLRDLSPRPPTWTAGGPDRWEQVDASLAPVGTIASAGEGAWNEAGSTRPLVASSGFALLDEEPLGLGTVLYLADPSPLQNRLLAHADDAALGLLLAGAPNRPVVFAEGPHGYGESVGLAAVPTRWKVALAGLLLGVLVLMWARGRRLGPPERRARELPPPRRAYVDALAATLARTRRPADALAPTQAEARRRLARRWDLPPDAPADQLREAAVRAGWDEELVGAVFEPVVTDDDALALGRALARTATIGPAGPGRDTT